ncbi:Associated kinase of Tb14-3-3 [Novymonas esmeraldas]|uniref:Associated kinase of Tb14-3-3 n=1 Tax=Novymonas esmeraldas TaxID=1808958 RepID=A0AAW0EWE9_9TRYP
MQPSSDHGAPAAGANVVVEGKYTIQDANIVGRGAYSVVKVCTPIPPYTPPGSRAGMKYVVKIIEKEYLISLAKGDVEVAMAEIKREIDVLRHIPSHENVVTFLEYVETEKQFLLFFEKVQCGDLCEVILQSSSGKLTEEKSRLYTYQIIKAVLHCHLHDIIHRDIKPENLLVSEDDNIKLTDFGLAKRSRGVCTGDAPKDPLDVTALMMPYAGCERLLGKRVVCSDVIGTPRYGAPEMFYAKFTQTHYDGFNADTWSIGVVTYITLSGSFPYSPGSNASEKEVFRTIMDTPLPKPPGISALAWDFVQSLLNKDPSKRAPLYAALNHPWLADVVAQRGSVVAAQLRAGGASAEVESAAARFDEEVRRLRLCMARLQGEVSALREERDHAREAQQPATQETHTQARRAQTPSGLSRPRSTRSPASTIRVSSPARVVTHRRTGSRESSSIGSVPRRSSVTRGRSPLARSAGGAAVRRGTPARAGGTTPARGSTPARTTAGGRSGSAARTTVTTRGATPTRPATPGHSAANRSRTPHSSGAAAGATNGVSSGASHSASAVNPANELRLGDQVTYKGYRAIVRFNGPTAFGAGIWIGLEMLEGNEGTNDGSSFIDKKQYFTCPKGKGVFVRASQVKRLG